MRKEVKIMTVTKKHKIDILENGFTTIDDIYSKEEIEQILLTIEKATDAQIISEYIRRK